MLHSFVKNISNQPDQPAFCINDTFYSYAYLGKRISAIVDTIQESKLRNVSVGVVLEDNIDTYASILAVWSSGNTFVPLHPAHPSDRLMSVIGQAEIQLVLSPSESYAWMNLAREQNVRICQTNQLEPSLNPPKVVNRKAEEIAYILFTSGSTGVPKGVPISVGNVESFFRNHDTRMGYAYTADDKVLQMFELTFDLSVVSFFAPLRAGACVYHVAGSNIKYTEIYRLLEEYDITSAILVPSVVSFLKPYMEDIDLPKLRYAMLSGEAVPHELTLLWMNCCPNAIFQNLYGPTEATIYCHTYTMPRSEMKSRNGIVCIGKPNLDVEAILLSEDGQLLTAGEKGELCVSGAQVTAGYLKNEEKNSEAFVEVSGKKFYRTGDLCVMDKDGDYFYLGRKDYQVKIQGFRVELSEVEHHARVCLNHTGAIALAPLDAQGNASIVLAVEGDEKQSMDLVEHLKAQMPSYMVPSRIVYIPLFPLNENGKTDRKALAKMILA